MEAVNVEHVDTATYARCGNLRFPNFRGTFPFKALSLSELHALQTISFPFLKTLYTKISRLKPLDLSYLSRSPKYYKKKLSSVSASKRINKQGGNFLLIPHLNKNIFKSIERRDSNALNSLVRFQVDAGSIAIVIPDYWKYTFSEYREYLKWVIKEAEQHNRAIFATLRPSEKETRIKNRVEEIRNQSIQGILVDVRDKNLHEKVSTVTFSVLNNLRKNNENLWVHCYDVSNRVTKTLCAEQPVLPMLGVDSLSSREPTPVPPDVRAKTAAGAARSFDSSTNGFLTKTEYLRYHSDWECVTHGFCHEESLDTIYRKSEKLRGHNILDQLEFISNFHEWISEESVRREMQKRVFAKQFITQNPLLGENLRRWSG